jgi:hypothetical protein
VNLRRQRTYGGSIRDIAHDLGLSAVTVSKVLRDHVDWNFNEVSFASGTAMSSLPFVKWGATFADLDNDGWLDLAFVNGHLYPQVDTQPTGARYKEPAILYLNQGDGSFCNATRIAGGALNEPSVSRGLAVGDLFNDGNLDLVIENIDGRPVVLKNSGIEGRHWVSFELAGTTSNRMALSAKVRIIAGGMTQTDEIHSGGSYLSQNDTRLHFGLGSARKIDSVEIRWPSGKIDRMNNLPADNYYYLLEGQGLVTPDKVRPVGVHVKPGGR